MRLNIQISEYLSEEIIDKIIKDLEESNGRKVKDFEFAFDEVEVNVTFGGKK